MTQSQDSIRAGILKLAAELGFDSCRIAQCDVPKHADEFSNWLRDGAAGEMGWLERGKEKRRDPQRVLPGARSVIVFALNYFQGVEAGVPPAPAIAAAGTAATTPSQGRIARYAWGDDYHEVIEKKLVAIDKLLREYGGTQKCYVDTGPVLERDYAAEAGIGWHGKSTMLVDAQLGTWFFLAEILTTLELAPDAPQGNVAAVARVASLPARQVQSPSRIGSMRAVAFRI